MKNTLLLILVLTGIAFAASFDRRSNNENQGEPVFRVEVPEITVAATSVTEITGTVNLNGIIRQIVVMINDNTGNATMDVEIRDDNNAVLWVENAIAEGTSTVFQYVTQSGTDFNMNIPVTNTITVAVSPSAAPGATTGLVNIVLYGE